MANGIGKEAISKRTKRDMKAIGVYKKQFDPLIEIYADLLEQYERLTTEFLDSGYQFEVPTDQGGSKKSPIVAALETLRKDVLAYSDRLCLNPKSLETVTVEKKGKSVLADALAKLG